MSTELVDTATVTIEYDDRGAQVDIKWDRGTSTFWVTRATRAETNAEIVRRLGKFLPGRTGSR